jgi:hypothetical protein
MLYELLTNMIVVSANRNAPGDGLSELHPSNNRVIGRKAPSMRTIGLYRNHDRQHRSHG